MHSRRNLGIPKRQNLLKTTGKLADEEPRGLSSGAMTFSSKVIAACALLILVYIGALSFWSEVRNEKDRQWVTHTLLVVEKLQTIRIDITQAETGQRGYMLTGQDRYLKLYQAGADQVHRDMKELPDLIQDNPRERDAIGRLEPLVAARLRELDDGIEVRKQSGLLAGVEAVARRNDGDLWMELIAAQIGEMRRTEAQLLTSRLQTAAASSRKMKVVVVCGNALAILILLMKGFVIHWETGRRNVAEQGLKSANERLEHRTSELSETNTELESFAYSVAHDLRAPLRHIAGYSRVLTQDYGPQFDEEGQRYLGKIAAGAEKMGRLVDELLNLSGIGRQDLALEATSLDGLLHQVVEELKPECAGRDVEWLIGSLFVAECDPGLMKQVFVNLLSNAVKYSGKRKHAVIEVGQMMQGDEHLIFVRDNGAGFEMQYVGKLFGVFQRLHKARDFAGTGVGLAIVQRIIRKHGGRVWADAKVDEGATFFFTLGTPEVNPATESDLGRIEKEEGMHV
jgi:signal transduction histidine kinase